MPTSTAHILPSKIQEQISQTLPHLSSEGKRVLEWLLQDSSHLLEKWIAQASENNDNFPSDLKIFLSKKKKGIIANMEEQEREQEIDIALSKI